MIANMLFDTALSIRAAEDGIGQVHVLDFGLQLAPIVLGDLAAEDDRDLVRPSDGSIGVKQAFAEHVQCGAATEDEVVAELDLREEQPALATRLLALSCGELGPSSSAMRVSSSSILASSACSAYALLNDTEQPASPALIDALANY